MHQPQQRLLVPRVQRSARWRMSTRDCLDQAVGAKISYQRLATLSVEAKEFDTRQPAVSIP